MSEVDGAGVRALFSRTSCQDQRRLEGHGEDR